MLIFRFELWSEKCTVSTQKCIHRQIVKTTRTKIRVLRNICPLFPHEYHLVGLIPLQQQFIPPIMPSAHPKVSVRYFNKYSKTHNKNAVRGIWVIYDNNARSHGMNSHGPSFYFSFNSLMVNAPYSIPPELCIRSCFGCLVFIISL